MWKLLRHPIQQQLELRQLWSRLRGGIDLFRRIVLSGRRSGLHGRR
jgi:hypothetical protein